MNGLVTNVVETNLNSDGKLVLGPTAKIDTGTFNHPAGSPPLTLGRHTAKLIVVDDSGNVSAAVTRDFFVRELYVKRFDPSSGRRADRAAAK